MGHVKPCKVLRQAREQTTQHNVDTRNPAVFEQHTPTGIRLTTVNYNSSRSDVIHVFNNFNTSRVFLPVIQRTTPPLTEDNPAVQALLEILQKNQIALNKQGTPQVGTKIQRNKTPTGATPATRPL